MMPQQRHRPARRRRAAPARPRGVRRGPPSSTASRWATPAWASSPPAPPTATPARRSRQASFLKLGMTYPLPKRLIAEFRSKVDKLYVVEELDPFLEENIRLQGMQVDGGKDILPLLRRVQPGPRGAAALRGRRARRRRGPARGGPRRRRRPARPPADTLPRLLAPRRVRRAAAAARVRERRHRLLHPRRAAAVRRHALQHLHGRQHQHGPRHDQGHGRPTRRPEEPSRWPSSATARSSTPASPRSWTSPTTTATSLTIILDNRTTAMTGGQENPGTGKTLLGEPRRHGGHPRPRPRSGHQAGARDRPVRPRRSARRCSRRRLAADEPSVVIAKSPCVLQYRIKRRRLHGRPRPLHRLQGLPEGGLHRPQPVQGRGRRAARSRSTPPSAPAAASAPSCASTTPSSRPSPTDGKDA